MILQLYQAARPKSPHMLSRNLDEKKSCFVQMFSLLIKNFEFDTQASSISRLIEYIDGAKCPNMCSEFPFNKEF